MLLLRPGLSLPLSPDSPRAHQLPQRWHCPQAGTVHGVHLPWHAQIHRCALHTFPRTSHRHARNLSYIKATSLPPQHAFLFLAPHLDENTKGSTTRSRLGPCLAPPPPLPISDPSPISYIHTSQKTHSLCHMLSSGYLFQLGFCTLLTGLPRHAHPLCHCQGDPL